MKKIIFVIVCIISMSAVAFADVKWAEIHNGKVRAITDFPDGFTPAPTEQIKYVELTGKTGVAEGSVYDGTDFHALGTAQNPFIDLLMEVACDRESLKNDGTSVANFTITIKDRGGKVVAANKTMEFVLTDTAGRKDIVPMSIVSGVATVAYTTSGDTGKFRIDPNDYAEITHNSKTFRLIVTGNTDLIVYRAL